jgi:hypothetical protein
VRVTIAAGSYQARQQAVQGSSCDLTDATWPTGVQLADGQLLAGTSPGGVVTAPAVTMTFDSLGRTDLGADQTISVGSISVASFALTVVADSGFVQAP